MSLTKVTETSRNSRHPQPALDWTCLLPEVYLVLSKVALSQGGSLPS